MDRLEVLLGDRFPGRESGSWVSFCVRILSGEMR